MTAGKAYIAWKTHAQFSTSSPRPVLVQRLLNLGWRSCLGTHGPLTLANGSHIASLEMSRVLGQPTANVCHLAGNVKRASCSSYHARAAYRRKALNAGRLCTATPRVDTLCRASSARADEPQLVRQRSQPWNYKLGAVYQNLLPGPLLFLPSLLQPVSTIISLEGAAHGHEWVHWLLSLLPVPQVTWTFTWLGQDFTHHGQGAWSTHNCCIQVVMQFPVLGLVDVLYQQHIDLANGVLDAAISLVGIYFSFVLMPAMDAVLGTDLHPKSMVSLLHRLAQYLVYCDASSVVNCCHSLEHVFTGRAQGSF